MTDLLVVCRSTALALFASGLALAANATEQSGAVCLQAASIASERTGVPYEVLVALTLTETGRTINGDMQPWPWSLNEGGTSHWFKSREAALDYLASALTAGGTNIDIGCFQLNFHWHGKAFPSTEEMMDPFANAIYAAELVRAHYAATGDWVASAGAYHSGTETVAARYLERFMPIYDRLASLGVAKPADPETADSAVGFRLLKRGATGSGGSIVPRAGSLGPLFGGA